MLETFSHDGSDCPMDSYRIIRMLGNGLVTFGLSICVAVLLGLTAASLVNTYANGLGSDLTEVLTRHNGLALLASTAFFIAVISIALLLFSKSPLAANWKRTLLVVCVAMAIVQVYWVMIQNTHLTYYGDPERLMTMARDWVSGSMELFDQELSSAAEMKLGTSYLTAFPYQAGMFFYYVLMYKIFADAAPLALQFANIVANISTVVALTSVGAVIVRGSQARSVMVILLGCCVPSLLYSSFLYANQIGFALASVFIALQIQVMCRADVKAGWPLLAFSIACYCCAVILKATLVVIGIAMAFAWAIKMLCDPRFCRFISLLTCVLALVLGNVAQKAPQFWIENRLGYSIGEGIPKTAWIVIGLQANSVLGENMPGWWNPYAQDIWIKTNNNYGEMQKLANEELLNLAEGFLSRPDYAFWFFSTKLATEWLVPDFQSRYFAGINYALIDGQELQFNVGLVGTDESSRMYAAASSRAWTIVEGLFEFMDGYQSFIYLFSAIGCIELLRDRQRRMEAAIFPCIFIVGFVLYVLWEAKAQYLLPFFMCLIPMGAYGFWQVKKIISRKISQLKSRS